MGKGRTPSGNTWSEVLVCGEPMPGSDFEWSASAQAQSSGVVLSLLAERAVLRVPDGVNPLRSNGLGAAFDAVIALGYRCVVLDLPSGDFLERSGELRVAVLAASRLIASAGELVIRGPSDTGGHVYDVDRLGELIRSDLPGTPPGDILGSEQSPRGAGPPLAGGSLDETARLEPGGSTPAATAVVDGVLRLLVALARATVGGADGVSVSLRRHGRLATVAASDDIISAMDADQYATGQGPCVDASVQGRWFHAESLAAETRWPAFTPQARQLGINAILSSPLVARDRPVGALNIYSRRTGAFAPEDQRLAAVFAAEASIILSEEGADLTTEQSPGRFGGALAAPGPRSQPAMGSENYFG